MDAHRFDALTRALAERPALARASRRRLLGIGLGTAALLGVAPRPAAAVGSATCRAAQSQDPSTITSKNACGVTPCGTATGCFCVQTLGHRPMCLVGFNPNRGRVQCPTSDECDAHRDCPRGRFCAKVEGCCGPTHNLCLRPCPA